MKEATHKKANAVGIHSHEVHTVVKFTDRKWTGLSWPGVQGYGSGGTVSFSQDENVLGICFITYMNILNTTEPYI